MALKPAVHTSHIRAVVSLVTPIQTGAGVTFLFPPYPL